VVENYPGGTSKFTIAALVIIIIVSAGFVYALTSGLVSIDYVDPTNPSNPNYTDPIQDIDDDIYVDGDLNMTALVEEYGFRGSGSASNNRFSVNSHEITGISQCRWRY